MKIIELLNKIANGEEVPKVIKYHNTIYYYDKYNFQYAENKDTFNTLLSEFNGCKWVILNDEIEIIEPQEHKIPKKLPYYSLEKIQKAKNKDEWREERISLLEKRIDDYHNKINEILDYLEVNNE